MRAARSKALIRAWLDFLPPPQRPVAERVRELVLGAVPALEESIRWGHLVLALATHKTGLHLRRLGRSEGADAGEPAERGLRLRHSEPLPEADILALVRTCAQDQAGTVAPPPPRQP